MLVCVFGRNIIKDSFRLLINCFRIHLPCCSTFSLTYKLETIFRQSLCIISQRPHYHQTLETFVLLSLMKSLCASIILGLATHSLAATAPAVDTRFQVDLSTNDVGGCGYIGRTFMQNVFQDALDLLNVGVKLATDYENDVEEAKRLLDSFFVSATPPLSNADVQAISSRSCRFPRSTYVAISSYRLQRRTPRLRIGL